MDTVESVPDDVPRVVETFEALEVMGPAEGFEVYTIINWSRLAAISVAR
jgi:hypothetical protein